jgi:hypothetical protein
MGRNVKYWLEGQDFFELYGIVIVYNIFWDMGTSNTKITQNGVTAFWGK